MFSKLLWILINLLQGIIILGWMAIITSVALFLMLITQNEKVGLWIIKNLYCPVVFWVGFIKIKTHGLENFKQSDQYVITSNHQSLLDIPLIFMVYPNYVYYLAKTELKNVPFVGWMVSMSGMIFVDRKNPDRARQSIENAVALVKKGKNVISYAEGTRTKTGEIAQFRKGSFLIPLQGNIPVLPMAIRGARECLASGSLKLRPGTIHVSFGKPIDSSNFDKSKPAELANFSRNKVIELYNALPS